MSERLPTCPICGRNNLTEVPHDAALGPAVSTKSVALSYRCECGSKFTVWKPVNPSDEVGQQKPPFGQ